MRKKRHIMQVPRTLGDVFAVEFEPQKWGFCRIIRATAVEIVAVFARAAGLPDIDWSSHEIERWRLFFFADPRQGDPTILPVGNVAFSTDAEADMPPTYREPDKVEPRYTIEERGMYRYTADPADLNGIAKQVTLTPATLGSFLKEQYHNGALREVGLRTTG